MNSSPAVLILASASPRRRELLWQLGVPHQAMAADLDERRLPRETAVECVQRLARQKAEHVWASAGRAAGLAVLGADTEVLLDDELLGKPADREHGLRMLQQLSGRTHRVVTAVTLVSADGLRSQLCESSVRFRELSADECARYWDSGEPRGKAGGYAIQGFGAAFIAELSGSYSSVMGLPLFEVANLLRQAGLPIWQRSAA